MQDINLNNLQGSTWYNRYNDDKFVIKEVIFDMNGTMQFYTTDGRTLTAEQINNYIQSDKPLNNISKTPKMQKIDLSGLDSETPLTDINIDILQRPLQAMPNQTHKHEQLSVQPGNYTIIDKAFKKVELPELNIDFTWNNYPKKEIELLVNIMDIDKQEIADYIIEKAFSKDFVEKIKESYKSYLINSL